MELDIRLPFESYLILERLCKKGYSTQQAIKTLRKIGIPIEDAPFLDELEDIISDWLYEGYIPTLPPKREAKILWAEWQDHHGAMVHKWRNLWKPDPTREGYVYLLKMGDYYKIGRTIDPLLRFPQIAIHMPQETRLWAIFWERDMYQTESAMHKFYGQYHTHGEWFSLPLSEAIYLRLAQGTTFQAFQQALKLLPHNEWGDIDFTVTLQIYDDKPSEWYFMGVCVNA